ncbi:MAG: ATP-binding protein [Alphaproteobacteria bacterium]|nr:ATP-binding protein [Alphaproteobacteria bacterium]
MTTLWFIYLIALVFIVLFLILYAHMKYTELRIHNQHLQIQNRLSKAILESFPLPWCAWHDGDTLVHCSPAFYRLLCLDPEYPVHVTNIQKIFGDSPFSPFQQAISHLQNFGGDFTVQISIPAQSLQDYTAHHDPHIHLELKGRIALSLHDEEKLPEQRLIILTLADITQTLIEKIHSQTIQKENHDELEMLHILADACPLALWYRDTVGRIQYCNLAYAGALESSASRVIAEKQELIDISHANNTYALSQKALRTNQKQTIRTHVVVAGHRRFLEIAEIPILGHHATAGHVTVGYALDLTEVEEAANELLTHTHAHHEVLDQVSSPIAIYGADTRLEFFNNAYVKQFNLDENWLYSKPTFGEILERLRENRMLSEYSNFPEHKRSRLSLFNNLIYPLYEMMHIPNGTIFRLMIAPHPLGGLLYMFENVTDKLALEQGYNTLVAVQKETLDHLYEGIVVFGSDNRVRLTNPAIGQIWRLTDEERSPSSHINDILEKAEHLFNDRNESQIWRKEMLDIISMRQSVNGRFAFKGDRRLEYSYVPLPDGSHLMTFVDVSDRWRFEQALKERTETLERADRIKSDFISHVSYELRSPLNTISGFMDILSNQYFGTLNERQLDYCKGVVESAERLRSLVNDMIDLANIEAGKLSLNYQETPLDIFLTGLTDLVHSRAQDKGFDIEVINDSQIEAVFIDRKRLKHAIFNLLTNAIKFTNPGGKISIIAQKSGDQKDWFSIAIQDNGIGINDDDQEKIFNLFEHGANTQNMQMGAGLGLPLVKSLIELHGGSMTLTSAPGKGTTFMCHLPINPQ